MLRLPLSNHFQREKCVIWIIRGNPFYILCMGEQIQYIISAFLRRWSYYFCRLANRNAKNITVIIHILLYYLGMFMHTLFQIIFDHPWSKNNPAMFLFMQHFNDPSGIFRKDSTCSPPALQSSLTLPVMSGIFSALSCKQYNVQCHTWSQTWNEWFSVFIVDRNLYFTTYRSKCHCSIQHIIQKILFIGVFHCVFYLLPNDCQQSINYKQKIWKKFDVSSPWKRLFLWIW